MKDKETRDDAVRLDKWLWAARFYKTRALARDMIDGGKVHYNGQRGKPSKNVELNAEIKLRQGNDERTVIVLALASQRRGADGGDLGAFDEDLAVGEDGAGAVEGDDEGVLDQHGAHGGLPASDERNGHPPLAVKCWLWLSPPIA